MSLNLEALLAPRTESPPSGENLEYDSDFTDMELAAQPGEERQMGSEILPGEDPDFADAKRKALAVMERAHELRAGIVYAYAGVNTEGIAGLADAVSYIAGCLEQHWATCHPELDADDDNDPTMRVNAVAGLASADRILQGLRKARLTNSRSFGRFSLRDIQVALGEMQPAKGETVVERTSVTAAFADTAENDPGFLENLLASAQRALAGIKAIDAKFMKEVPGRGPNLDDLQKMVQQIIRHLSEHVAAAPVAEAEAEGTDMAEATTSGQAASAQAAPAVARVSGGAPGTVSSRSDVVAALDAVMDYYRRHEPSSPVPILLERAKRLVNADFLTILKDIAPSGVDNVMLIGGMSDGK